MYSEFTKITFPIIIKDGDHLDIAFKLKDFLTDPDFYFHEYDSKMELIDSMGNLWNWKYDHINKSNIPGDLIKTLPPIELKKIISNFFKGSKIKNDVQSLLKNVTSVEEIIDKISDKL